MTNWLKYWTSRPEAVGDKDYLAQVDKTLKGRAISDWQFQLIVSEICHHLDLGNDDIVLDLCCGNGLITKELAKKSKAVVGVDFSPPLLEIANRDHRPTNVTYRNMSVLELYKMSPSASGSFDKILMYAGLQFFRKRDLITILNNILQLSSQRCVMLFGSIPDKEKKWQFYNTPKRKLNHFWHMISGRDRIGTWWDKQFIERTCKQLGLQCEFYEQNKELHTAQFRFDITISTTLS